MNKRYRDFKLELLKRYPVCEVCSFRTASQINHILYHKHGRLVSEMAIYDSFENCQSCCPTCNTGYGDNANSRKQKKKHWAKRVIEGYDMEKWNEQIGRYRREGFSE